MRPGWAFFLGYRRAFSLRFDPVFQSCRLGQPAEIHRGHKVLLYFRPNSQAYLPCRSKRPTYSKADAESEGR